VNLRGAHVVVTGGASGIGAAMARRFAGEEPAGIVVADLDGDAAKAVAGEVEAGGVAAIGVAVDVGGEAELRRLVAEAEERFGPVDAFFSNAGIPGPYGGPEVPDEDWQRIWEINVMAHIWAARILLPGMLDRGRGHLGSTASAAGLLANPGLMPYSVTKHAAVAVAEWLAITYGGEGSGVGFSCLCPQGVATPMLETWRREDPSSQLAAASGGDITPEEAADAVVAGIAEGRLLILPHPEVETYMQRRAGDHERWLGGMQRFQVEIDRMRAAQSGD
jgi:NAD(P)-dependent dehydrogenase (short-subunit alcohol dehydrogenase family)